MDLNTLPREPTLISSAIESAQQAGPAAIARLATWCLWHVGQRDDPRRAYTGPDGLRPLEHLLAVFDAQRQASEPWFVTTSDLSDLTRRFPPPQPVWPPPPTLSAAEAQSHVDAVLAEISLAAHPGRKRHLAGEGLAQLARQGVTGEPLQPLVRWISEHPCTGWLLRDNALPALLLAGEDRPAQPLLEAVPVFESGGAYTLIECARTWIEIGRSERARQLLERLRLQLQAPPAAQSWAQRQMIQSFSFERMRHEIADCYAYLGEADLAHALTTPAALEIKLRIECLLAWQHYFTGCQPDVSPIMALLRKTRQVEPPKHRAATQTGILKCLLAIEAYEAAWQTLPLLQATLLSTPLWGKLEYRVNDAAGVLQPHLAQHTAVIFPFARSLLTAKARDTSQDGGLWAMVHVVSGLGWLILGWAAPAEVDALIDFLRSWRDSATVSDEHSQIS